MSSMNRRDWLSCAGVALAGGALAPLGQIAFAAEEERRFAPTPGRWRSFELTTRVEVLEPVGTTRVWLPVPSIDSDFQRSYDSRWEGSAKQARLLVDPAYGARMLYAEFAPDAPPVLELTSRVLTQDRAVDWRRRDGRFELEPAAVKAWTDPTDLIPTDGIVVFTAKDITKDAGTDREKVQAIYDWVVANTFREPKVRGCGVGDVKAMLETGNFGGKCGDINGLFVGLCRAVGVPARDLYGIRLVPSAFGYRELGGNPAKLQGAQHCRAEVFLREHGWVAMDPADVGKVMRQETPVWIKDASNALVAPVKAALFGGWEGNWLAFNAAHDVALPHAQGPKLGFLMYPQAENDKGRLDALDPDRFRYTITAKETTS
jgi:transglutaminase-like putative cysteine protease